MRRVIFGWIVFVSSIASGVYVGAWLMFIKPIIEVCKAFDAGTLTGLLVGTTVLKCLFSSVVGWMFVYVGSIALKLAGQAQTKRINAVEKTDDDGRGYRAKLQYNQSTSLLEQISQNMQNEDCPRLWGNP